VNRPKPFELVLLQYLMRFQNERNKTILKWLVQRLRSVEEVI